MRRPTMAVVLSTVLALAAGAAAAQDGYWGDDPNDGWASFTESRAACKRVKSVGPPASDMPDAATAAALKGCSSVEYYYGIGRPKDGVKARQCALLEFQSEQQETFSGPTMLMMIYANGVGGKRDLDVATHMACVISGAPMEVDARVNRLQAMKRAGAEAEEFDYCDDITSGMASGQCAALSQDMAGARRKAGIAALTAKWTPAQKTALAAAQKAETRFAEAVSGNEVDLSGTARGAFAVEAEEAIHDFTAKLLEQIAQGKVPAATPVSLKAADAALNAAYRRVMAKPPEYGTVTKDGVRAAQRVWLGYRDAWIALARVRAPASADAVARALTVERTRMLNELVSE